MQHNIFLRYAETRPALPDASAPLTRADRAVWAALSVLFAVPDAETRAVAAKYGGLVNFCERVHHACPASWACDATFLAGTFRISVTFWLQSDYYLSNFCKFSTTLYLYLDQIPSLQLSMQLLLCLWKVRASHPRCTFRRGRPLQGFFPG